MKNTNQVELDLTWKLQGMSTVTWQASRGEREGGHFVHSCKIYNLQVTELPGEPYLSASFYLRIFTILLFRCLLEKKSGDHREGNKHHLLRKVWEVTRKVFQWIANVPSLQKEAVFTFFPCSKLMRKEKHFCELLKSNKGQKLALIAAPSLVVSCHSTILIGVFKGHKSRAGSHKWSDIGYNPHNCPYYCFFPQLEIQIVDNLFILQCSKIIAGKIKFLLLWMLPF